LLIEQRFDVAKAKTGETAFVFDYDHCHGGISQQLEQLLAMVIDTR
jgi:hypothetical protein